MQVNFTTKEVTKDIVGNPLTKVERCETIENSCTIHKEKIFMYQPSELLKGFSKVIQEAYSSLMNNEDDQLDLVLAKEYDSSYVYGCINCFFYGECYFD